MLIGAFIGSFFMVVAIVALLVAYFGFGINVLTLLYLFNGSAVIATVIGLFTVVIPCIIWQFDLVKPEEAHKDKLKFDNYDEFLDHAKDYLAIDGFVSFSNLIYGIPKKFTVYHNITNKVGFSFRSFVHTLIFIVDIESFSEEMLKSLQSEIRYIEGQVRNLAEFNSSPFDKLFILNVHNINEEFFDYYDRNPMVDTMSGKIGGVFMSGISFENKTVYIQKQFIGKGMAGYKKMLPLFCNLMQIETPNFRNKKKKVKDNKGEEN